MNREIKFRAWDNKEKKLYYFDLQKIIGDSSPVVVAIKMKVINYIMQYIGLLDKKEIYEGDIVKVERLDSFSSWNKAIIVYSDHHASFLLQYTKPIEPKGILADCSRIISKDKKTLFGHIYEWTIEIIGNIFENPELLTKETK